MYYLIYPILIAFIPINSIYVQNILEIKRKAYYEALFFVSLFICGLFFVFLKITHNPDLSALVATVNLLMLTKTNDGFVALYSQYKRTLSKYKILYTIKLIAICTLISVLLITVLKINLAPLSKILFYLSLIINALLFFDIYQKKSKTIEKPTEYDNKQPSENLPDIYHLILDMHVGFDKPEFCDHDFRSSLKERGFDIYDNFTSNYERTNLSVPSMLNMDYMHKLIQEQTNVYAPEITLPFYAENVVFSTLNSLGYKLNFVVNHLYDDTLRRKALQKDSFQPGPRSGNVFFQLFFFTLIPGISINLKNYVIDIIEKYSNINVCKERPTFNFMHILAPHGPYLCDENGNPTPKEYLYYADGCYLGYQKYLNKKIIKLIDDIQKKMKKNSIIIIHGDHGIPDSDCCWKILIAIKTPEDKPFKFNKRTSSLVNLYRCIFNRYLNTNLDLLNTEHYNSNIIDFIVKKAENELV